MSYAHPTVKESDKTMRKLGISALVAATLFLAACGGDDEPGDDATTTAEETPAADATDEAAVEDEGGEPAATDLQGALLAADDLPEGATVSAFDVAQLSSAIGRASCRERVSCCV